MSPEEGRLLFRPEALPIVFRTDLRFVGALAGVAVLTILARMVVPLNPTSVGFAYLLLVLIVASTSGFVVALVASVAATLTFNFFFLPPVGTFTISDPENWIALFSFTATSLIASRLSHQARQRAMDALERQQDVERLYTFSRAILLIESTEPFAKQLAHKLAQIFGLNAAVLYDRRTGEFWRAGPSDFEGLDDQIRDAASHGTSFSDTDRRRTVTAVRLGSEPIASLALQGQRMPDSVLQGIGNLVAIGLERARSQDLERQVEVARQSEQLRTTLIDAMSHEFKTPLTSIKAATTSLLANPEQPAESRTELLKVADEEAEHLRRLIDDAVEMARLDRAHIDVHLQPSDLASLVREVVASMRPEIADRPFELRADGEMRAAVDRRLFRLAFKQLLDNALKYSPPGAPVAVVVDRSDTGIGVEITDHGAGIPEREQGRIFERFYRSPSVRQQIPGSGLGLSIAYSIARAHNGDLTVTSRPGETTFRLSVPAAEGGGQD
jgi:two-component system sensor histidine kinase KdpD